MAVKIKDVSSDRYAQVVEWYQSNRRRRKYFETKAEAKRFARGKEIELARYGSEDRPLSPMERAAVSEARHHSIDLMGAVEAQIARKTEGQCSVTVDEAISKRLTDLVKTSRPSHVIDQRYRLNKFRRSFGERLVSEVSSSDVDAWFAGLKLAPQSVLNMARSLSALWELAKRQKWASENIIQSIDRPRVLRGEIGILTPNQLRELLTIAESPAIPAITIAAFGGLRQSEIKSLVWNEVFLERGFIEVTSAKSKTASRRLVDITPNLRSWLEPFVGSGNVWPNSNAPRRATKAVSFVWPKNALRHSFATYHLALHQSAEQTALQLGHSTTAMLFQHYRELATKETAEEWFSICPRA